MCDSVCSSPYWAVRLLPVLEDVVVNENPVCGWDNCAEVNSVTHYGARANALISSASLLLTVWFLCSHKANFQNEFEVSFWSPNTYLLFRILFCIVVPNYSWSFLAKCFLSLLNKTEKESSLGSRSFLNILQNLMQEISEEPHISGRVTIITQVRWGAYFCRQKKYPCPHCLPGPEYEKSVIHLFQYWSDSDLTPVTPALLSCPKRLIPPGNWDYIWIQYWRISTVTIFKRIAYLTLCPSLWWCYWL